jgi:hypothetical protein
VVSFPLAFPPIIYKRSSSPHSCYMARPSYPPRLDSIISYGEIRFDIRVLWITSSFRDEFCSQAKAPLQCLFTGTHSLRFIFRNRDLIRETLPLWGSRGMGPLCLTSVLDGGEWSASRLDRFIPRRKSPRYPLQKRLGVSQDGLNTERYRNILIPNTNKTNKQTTNSMVSVRERTIPTERPPLVGEVIANFCG